MISKLYERSKRWMRAVWPVTQLRVFLYLRGPLNPPQTRCTEKVLMWKAEMLDKCPPGRGLCPRPDDAFFTQMPAPPQHASAHTHAHSFANTDAQRQQFQRGQHLFGDKVTLLPGGLWTSTIEASHPAHTQLAVLGCWWVEKGGVCEASQHPSIAVLKPYSGSPPWDNSFYSVHRRSKIPACKSESRSQQMEQLLSEGSRRQRRLPIHPCWKQWGSRSRVLSPRGRGQIGLRWGRHALTKSSYVRSLNAEGLSKSFLDVKCRGEGGGDDLSRGLFGVHVGGVCV